MGESHISRYLTIDSWDSIFLLRFYFKSNHFKVGIMLCREDNDKVSGGKFRKIFFNFPENTNEKL